MKFLIWIKLNYWRFTPDSWVNWFYFWKANIIHRFYIWGMWRTKPWENNSRCPICAGTGRHPKYGDKCDDCEGSGGISRYDETKISLIFKKCGVRIDNKISKLYEQNK